jgi:sugar lactone lactonase YvrE
VAKGPDGAYYVGELTGFPFLVGAARVWRVVPGKAATVYATGFTNIIDLAFDRRGRLVVLEIAKNSLLSGDPTGALIRVNRDGSRTEIASAGLVTPTSVAVADDGTFYVSNKGTMAGTGEVLRIRP